MGNLRKKIKDFRFNISISSLNQSQGSVFMLWEWAESISRIKLITPRNVFFTKIFKKKIFFGERAPVVTPSAFKANRAAARDAS
jgi:hypothetical protein